jgi:hypothetical protein
MKETTKKLLPGRLMLVAACLFFITAAIGNRSTRAAFLGVGAAFLCIGIVSLRKARRQP